MTVLNKVSENLEAVKCMAGSAVIYNVSLQSHAICLVYSTAERSLLAHALRPNRKLISCSFLFECKTTERPCEFTGRKLNYKFNKQSLRLMLT